MSGFRFNQDIKVNELLLDRAKSIVETKLILSNLITCENEITLSILLAVDDTQSLWIEYFPVQIEITARLNCKVKANLLTL